MKTLLTTLGLAFALAAPAQAHSEDLSRRIAHKRLELAADLAAALHQNQVCDTDAYPSSINQLVESAWHSASEESKTWFLGQVPADSVLQGDLFFRHATERFRYYNVDLTLEEATKAITSSVHYSLGLGAYGSQYNVTLGEGGVAVERRLELIDEDPGYRWVESKTTWALRKIESSDFFPFVIKIGAQEFRLRFAGHGNRGAFWLVPTDAKEDEVDQRTLSSEESYCEA